MSKKIEGVDLEGKLVRLWPGRVWHPYEVGYAFGGFGCDPGLRGKAVFVRYMDGHTKRIERCDVEAVVDGPEEV
jgi:hypothetical protein